MIQTALEIIQAQVNAYLNLKFEVSGSRNIVTINNVSQLDNQEGGPVSQSEEKKIFLSLVNIEEEKTLKNGSFYKTVGDSMFQQAPPAFLNLYILFSAIAKSEKEYLEGLRVISHIVAFFQSKKVIDQQNSPALATVKGNEKGELKKLVFDLNTLNYENLNHLWGILGGKYLPSVMYKVRMVTIQEETLTRKEPIRAIGTKQNAY